MLDNMQGNFKYVLNYIKDVIVCIFIIINKVNITVFFSLDISFLE